MSEQKLRDYLNRVTSELRRTREELHRRQQEATEPIAVVGMACRFPGGVTDPQQLWDLVSTGGDAISPFPTDRGWDLERLHATSSTTASGFLRDIDRFDAEFFGISPREAMAMDPQQRLLLETAWHALEDGGIPPASLRGGATGTFMGTCGQDYPHLLEGTAEDVTGYVSIGSHASVLSGRIAYTLGLQGPALTIDTACSASLVATHTAVRSLRSGECPLALAGGVIIMTTPRSFTEFTKQGGLSGDGRCRSFSDDADGTAWSEGVAVLVLERLSDAVRNGHRVHAVIRGSAINQDGASNGLTAPNGAAQQEVIWRALADARLTPADIDVVEAHGTGTKLGDPIEAGALLATYGGERERPLWLGSMKSNIGHSQAAAGAGALIKMAFAMRHGVLPASLHVGTPSTHVDWSAGDIRLLTENTPWPETGRPRRVAISSFGVSGTNAHLILEEPPTGAETPAEPPARAETPLLLNARTPAALARQAASLATHLDTHPGISLADVAHTLAEGRNAFEHRAVVLAADHTGAAAALRALADGEEHPDVVPGAAVGESQPVFLFPGQGSQWAGMAVELLDSSPEFAKSIAACEAAFAPHVDFSLTEVLRAGEFGRVDVVQPVLFAVMVSLAALWRAHGVVPAAVVGHSQGEIAAAYVAGALSLEDAARVVCLRSKLIREVLGGRGGMASVSAPLPEVLELCGPELSVAAVNGPESVVVSGPAEAIEDLVATATVRVRRIDVDYASHSADVESLREPLLAQLREVAPRPVEVPMLSTLTGAFLTGTELDADYWYRNLREPVQLEQATRTLLAAGHRVFVEASPHPVLTTGLYETAEAAGTPAHAVPSLRREDGGLARFARSLAVAHVLGVPVGWDLSGALTGLPGYAFEPTRFWPRPGTAAGRVTDAGLADPEHPLLAGSAELPGVDGFLFTGVLSTRTQPWLADHAVGGEVLLPGTGLLELAGRAADEAGCGQVEELVLEQPLVLPATGSVTTSVHLGEADEHGRRALTIHSRTDGPWRRNATGTVAPAPAEAPAAAHWPPAGAREQDVSGLYAELAATGFAYGPAFQGLRRVWTEGEEVYAEVALPEPVAADATGYRLHPALLDAALHAARFGGFAAALPFSFSGARLHARAAAALLVRLRRTGPDSLALTAVDPAGQPVLEVDSLTLRAPRRSAPAGAEGALHRLHWLPVESTATGPVWTRVPAATLPELRPGTGQVVAIDLTRPAGAVPAANRELVAGTADLLRAWLAGDQPEDVPLVLLTRGGVAVDPGEDADPVLAAVRGLVRSAQTENPGRFVLLDTDVAEVPGELAARVPASGEPELALREGVLLAPRLGAPTGLQRPPGEVPWRLETTGKGDLSHLALVPAPEAAAPLGPREVRLAVRASGINFRDVFDALGMNRR
ncbi:type I polyketide synthase, partial [Crossiella equi]